MPLISVLLWGVEHFPVSPPVNLILIMRKAKKWGENSGTLKDKLNLNWCRYIWAAHHTLKRSNMSLPPPSILNEATGAKNVSTIFGPWNANSTNWTQISVINSDPTPHPILKRLGKYSAIGCSPHFAFCERAHIKRECLMLGWCL